MTVSHISTTLDNNGSVFLDSTTVASIAAVTGDKLLFCTSWRDGSAETLSAPTWNGQTFTIIGSVINTTEGKIALYQLTAGASTTSNVAANFSGFVYHNTFVSVFRDSGVGTMTFSSITQNLYNSGTYAAPSATKTGVPSGAIFLSILSAMGWDTGFSDVTATTWSGNKTSRGTITNTGHKAVNQLKIQSAAGAGADITATWTESAAAPMYTHLVLYLEAAAITSVTLTTPVVVGSTGNTLTSVGLGTITSLTNATITSTAANSAVYTQDAFQNGVEYMLIGVTQAQTAGDGTLTASYDVVVNPPAGYTCVTMVDPLDTGDFALGKSASVYDGVQIILPTAAGTVASNSSLSGYTFGTWSGWLRDANDSKMYTLTLTITDSGIIFGGLSMSSLVLFML